MTVETRPTPLVDAHCHVFKADMPLRDNPRHAPDYDFTGEMLMEVLDSHGVGFAVLAAASPWLDYNDYLIDVVRSRPRLRGTVIVEPGVEKYTLERMAEDGIVGVRLHMIGLDSMPDITSFEYRRTFHRIADLGWHIHLHCAGKDLPDLLPHVEASGAKVVLDHLGRPDESEGTEGPAFRAMAEAMERGRTWVKASGPHRLGFDWATTTLQELIRRSGTERLVWASDCPFVGSEETSYQKTVDWLLDAVDDPVARKGILGDNSLELYFS